jgi:3-mercaptopyruvate sulfurtransferase SseA
MMNLGVKNVKTLLGGYGAWVSSGLPVAKGDAPK